MKEFLIAHYDALIKSAITIVWLILIRLVADKSIRRVGKISDINQVRTRLIIKYVNAGIILIAIATLSFIWSVDFKEIGLLFSSIFAILGVALFAQWSILSNITAGIILFFSFPFKIGDCIRIQDKDFPTEAIIEDIKAFHLILKTQDGEIVTYPNNLILQKGVSIIQKYNGGEGGQ
ncbi:mechanosensitive ion channel domain-containing protein [Ascidiimonas sp. W6]|uniref:mechanosensitive ion channel domain-containing protein n=1 Tax=Ascidiimonas meishanensis TaxID=3128903 RepID=UPI0030EE66A3